MKTLKITSDSQNYYIAYNQGFDISSRLLLILVPDRPTYIAINKLAKITSNLFASTFAIEAVSRFLFAFEGGLAMMGYENTCLKNSRVISSRSRRIPRVSRLDGLMFYLYEEPTLSKIFIDY